MQVAYLIEYRQPPKSNKSKPRWLAVGIVSAPPALDVTGVMDRIRDEYPTLNGHEIRVRFFHPLPGCKIDGTTSNVLVIDSAVAPIRQQNPPVAQPPPGRVESRQFLHPLVD